VSGCRVGIGGRMSCVHRQQQFMILHCWCHLHSGKLHCDIPVVISNHPDLGHVADMFGVRFEHLGSTWGSKRSWIRQWQSSSRRQPYSGWVAVVWVLLYTWTAAIWDVGIWGQVNCSYA
jgi:hypothetical protein